MPCMSQLAAPLVVKQHLESVGCARRRVVGLNAVAVLAQVRSTRPQARCTGSCCSGGGRWTTSCSSPRARRPAATPRRTRPGGTRLSSARTARCATHASAAHQPVVTTRNAPACAACHLKLYLRLLMGLCTVIFRVNGTASHCVIAAKQRSCDSTLSSVLRNPHLLVIFVVYNWYALLLYADPGNDRARAGHHICGARLC